MINWMCAPRKMTKYSGNFFLFLNTFICYIYKR
uniref:Uncharacterized protein n=1 Tax=Arundo donax TaxID=35708 RepID=A0A0A8XV26_ARUDO